jgi:DNA-binding NarL/FixJ family response regulator
MIDIAAPSGDGPYGCAVPPASDTGSARESSSDPSVRRQRLPDGGLLIVDDCTLHRDNLIAVLTQQGIANPAAAWDLPSLVAALEGSVPRVVLLNMATHGSHLLLRAVMDIRPGVRVIAQGASEDNQPDLLACAEAGVAAYHMRGDSLDDLLVLIDRVAAGESFCPPAVSAILLRRLSALAAPPRPVVRELALTAREDQILGMLELGRSNMEIANHLRIAVHTVKNHVHNVLTKLGVSTRAEAAAVYRSMRLERSAQTRTRPRSNEN